MKAISRNLLAVIALLAASASGVQAQDAAGPAALPAVHIYFRTLGVLNREGGDLYYNAEQKDVAINADENIRSDFYEYKGPVVISFYHLKVNPDRTVARLKVADVDLTGTGAWPLLLLSKGKPPGASQQITAVPDDLVAFPASSYRFINHSKSSCSCAFGNDTFVLAAGEIKLLPPPTLDPAHRAISVQVTGGVPRHLFYTSNWALLRGQRTMVFIDEGAADYGVARRIIEGPEILAAEMKKVSRH